MCYFKSFVLKRTGELLSSPYLDSHSSLIAMNGLEPFDNDRAADQVFVKLEFTPGANSLQGMTNVDHYNLRVDEKTTPDWAKGMLTSVEKAIREKIEKMIIKDKVIDMLQPGEYILLGDTEIAEALHCRFHYIAGKAVVRKMEYCHVNDLSGGAAIGRAEHCSISRVGDNSAVNTAIHSSFEVITDRALVGELTACSVSTLNAKAKIEMLNTGCRATNVNDKAEINYCNGFVLGMRGTAFIGKLVAHGKVHCLREKASVGEARSGSSIDSIYDQAKLHNGYGIRIGEFSGGTIDFLSHSHIDEMSGKAKLGSADMCYIRNVASYIEKFCGSKPRRYCPTIGKANQVFVHTTVDKRKVKGVTHLSHLTEPAEKQAEETALPRRGTE